MRTPCAGCPTASSVTMSPGEPGELGAVVHGDDAAAGPDRLEVQRRVLGRAEQQEVGQRVVDAPTPPADDDDPGCTESLGHEHRELEIGVVLGRRVALDRRTGAFGRREEPGVDGVEVADHDVGGDPEPRGLFETRVGRDHGRVPREPLPQPVVDGIAAREHEHRRARLIAVHRPPSAGITRSRFEGSVAMPGRCKPAGRPPSQPGFPELPVGVAATVRPPACCVRSERMI